MTKRLLIAPILVAFLAACAAPGGGNAPGPTTRIEAGAPETAGFSSDRLARITSAFKAEVDRGGVARSRQKY